LPSSWSGPPAWLLPRPWPWPRSGFKPAPASIVHIQTHATLALPRPCQGVQQGEGPCVRPLGVKGDAQQGGPVSGIACAQGLNAEVLPQGFKHGKLAGQHLKGLRAVGSRRVATRCRCMSRAWAGVRKGRPAPAPAHRPLPRPDWQGREVWQVLAWRGTGSPTSPDTG